MQLLQTKLTPCGLIVSILKNIRKFPENSKKIVSQFLDFSEFFDYFYSENHTKYIFSDYLYFKLATCPSNCQGNGECSKEGICHCYEFYFGIECQHCKFVFIIMISN